MMKLLFSSLMDSLYHDSLIVTKNEQPDTWSHFVKAVPPFSFFNGNCIHLCAFLSRIKYHKIIKHNIKQYSNYWKKIEGIVVPKLEKLFDTKITYTVLANVCITPLFMRDINEHEFLIPTNSREDRIIQLIIHELSHFYFFESLKDKDPYDEKTWMLSEIIVPYILERLFPDTYTFKHSYAGVASLELEKCIASWLDNKYSFIVFIEKACEMDEFCRI